MRSLQYEQSLIGNEVASVDLGSMLSKIHKRLELHLIAATDVFCFPLCQES